MKTLRHDVLFLRDIERIYSQGPRATAELIIEMAERFHRQHSTRGLVRDYAELPPNILRILGIDGLPFPRPFIVFNPRVQG